MRIPSSRFARLTLVLLLCVPLAGLAAGKTYRWKDANGRMHYSDVPAPRSQELIVRTASGTQPAKPAEDAAPKETKEVACQRKREQLATYISASKVTETDTLGNTRTYSDEEKDKLVQRTQTQVRDVCGTG